MEILRKLLFFHFPAFVLMVFIAFLALQYSPGDAAKSASIVSGESSVPGNDFSNDYEKEWIRAQNLDKPVFFFSISSLSQDESSWKYWIPVLEFNDKNRFSIWLSGDRVNSQGVLQGDFGYSYRTRKQVSEIIAHGIRNTMTLTSIGLLLAFLLGVPIGLSAAKRKGSFFEKAIDLSCLVLLAVPLFWTATLLAIFFTDQSMLGWLPAPGSWPLEDQKVQWKQWILPMISFSLLPAAFLIRWVNKNAQSELEKEYIKTAKAKGTPERRIMYAHVLRNLSADLLAILGHLITVVLSGTVLIETIYAIPGIGWTIFQASESKDLPVLSALVLMYLMIAIIAYILTDLLSMRIDKRRNLDIT